MMVLTLTAPKVLNGDGLVSEIAAAGHGNVRVTLVGSDIVIAPVDNPKRVLNEAAIAAVVKVHTGAPTAVQAAAIVRDRDATDSLDKLVGLFGAGTRLKLREVSEGHGGFTPLQRDQLLAMIALQCLRDRTDT